MELAQFPFFWTLKNDKLCLEKCLLEMSVKVVQKVYIFYGSDCANTSYRFQNAVDTNNRNLKKSNLSQT